MNLDTSAICDQTVRYLQPNRTLLATILSNFLRKALLLNELLKRVLLDTFDTFDRAKIAGRFGPRTV